MIFKIGFLKIYDLHLIGTEGLGGADIHSELSL